MWMDSIFEGAACFYHDLSEWDVSNLISMRRMFREAACFNQNLATTWNMSYVFDMSDIFREASSFNQDISGWNVAKVTNMSGMFNSAIIFDQNLRKWNISNVKYMNSMFEGALSFNQDIRSWDTRCFQCDRKYATDVQGLPVPSAKTSVYGWSVPGWGLQIENIYSHILLSSLACSKKVLFR